ncbi:coiled-coil domain-containing protein 39-like [Polistes fuscatus]|uniref:coiled-coil domain-containing protein 39-like n=1 Tax=Polistes fuscatus TaxID=30207 RepID=UPI001CA8F701|nr:coiled-coil domain-containing protein 39-like [Polistes fuscatus]
MMIDNIDDILKDLGWDDGFRIPVANEENKNLEEEIEKKTKYKITLHKNLESMEEHLKMIKKHAVNIKVQHNINQNILTAHSALLEKEDHLYKISNSTESNLRQEMRDFTKTWNDVNERVSNIEKDLAKITNKIENSKKAVKFDENDLLRWEEVLHKKEEDNELIEEYMKQDTKKYKELEQKRQKLSIEAESYQRAIVKAVNEAQEMEIALDRTIKLYDKALKERRQMINQWTQSVAMLRQRDDNIQARLRELETLREVGKHKMDLLHETEQFLNDQILNNKQLEESIKESEKKIISIKDENHKIVDTIGTYEFEVRQKKKDIENLGRRVQQIRTEIKRKKNDIENKITKIDDWKKRIEDSKMTLYEIDDKKLNVEDRTKQLEEMIEEEEKRKSNIMKEANRLQTLILRTANEISKLNSEQKILEMQNQNERKKYELLLISYDKEKKLLEERKESLYHVEFMVHKCEIKLDRVKGHERDQTELEKKQKMIEDLENVLSEKMKIAKLLKTQITSLEYDRRKISNSIANDSEELEHLKNKKQDLLLLVDGGEKILKSAQTHNEERQVEENILRLKVSQIEQMMSNVGDKVYNLQKYRLKLDAALREREEEIAVQKEALMIQKRVVAGECSQLRNAIAERKNRIKQLQARYDSGVAIFGSSTDGTTITTTYLKIQNAQERYLLQEQGDKLDETIRKTESEIVGIENTLRIVNACNNKFKSNLSTVDETGPDQEEQNKLDEQLYKERENLKKRQLHMKHLTKDFQKMQNNYTLLLDDIQRAKEEKDNKEQQLSNLNKQITEQDEKISRAEKSLRKVHRDIQNKCTCTDDSLILLQEKDANLREIQEQNALALEDIAEFTIRHIEVEPYIKKLLAAKNIELPCICRLIDRSPAVTHCGSTTESTECIIKSTNRTSAFPSSRESINSIITLEPCFDNLRNSSQRNDLPRKNLKYGKTSTKAKK